MHARPLALALLLTAGAARPALAQRVCLASPNPVQMSMLLEATIFKVDVLTLSVRLDGAAAQRLRDVARTRALAEPVRDSVAMIAADATCASARMDFVRDVSMSRFLDGVRESGRVARDAGFIEPETFWLIDASLPEWYAFLEGRGVRDGDWMSYRIRGDTLDIRYTSADGELLLEQRDVGAELRRSILAGYFARGSDFREGLIESLFREEQAARERGAQTPGARP